MLPILFAIATALDVTGFVFLDQNANGRRDAGEVGIEGVAISDQIAVALTDADGSFRIAGAGGFGLVFVSVPDGYRSVGRFWLPVTGSPVEFALTRTPPATALTFVHASDTHISPASLGRTQRLRALVDSIRPDFVIITGDLVRDALRVPEAEATGYYRLFEEETSQFTVPVWTVPGNHEIFGIERQRSVSTSAIHSTPGPCIAISADRTITRSMPGGFTSSA